jgi:hypothetical protein
MEVDFDKEIDALMRSSGGGRTITISEFAAPHIDADTLNAFAENALPDAARKGYMSHLADCDGCRKTLSSLISMNAEAEPVSAVSTIPAVVAETRVPWYKSLFAVQNLAYGMGALVVLFAGFIGYIVLQNNVGDSAATISQVAEQRQASGPMASDSDTFAANTSTNTAVSSAANANASTDVSANKQQQPAELAKGAGSNTIVGEDLAAASKPSDPAITTDGITAAPPPQPAAAAPVTRPEPKELMSEADKSKDDAKVSDLKVLRQEEQMPSAGNMPNTQAGPSRNTQRDNRVSNERESAKKRAVTSPSLGRIASPSKTVGGKNFSKREGVWYDSSYTGQATTNVRRGTEDYRKLDSGLRTIAESLDGVVVVVWRSKAYRIQ